MSLLEKQVLEFILSFPKGVTIEEITNKFYRFTKFSLINITARLAEKELIERKDGRFRPIRQPVLFSKHII